MSPFFNLTYAKKACNATGKATPATLRRQNILYRIVHRCTILSHNTSGLHLKVASPSSIDLVKRSGCNHKAFDCSRALQSLLSVRSLLSLLSQYFHCACCITYKLLPHCKGSYLSACANSPIRACLVDIQQRAVLLELLVLIGVNVAQVVDGIFPQDGCSSSWVSRDLHTAHSSSCAAHTRSQAQWPPCRLSGTAYRGSRKFLQAPC